MRPPWKEAAVVAIAVGAAVSAFATPSAVASPPGATPITVKYVAAGAAKGSGQAIAYKGGVYIPLSAVKQLTGEQASWDAATSTVSVGAPAKASVYLEDLRGQPYDTVSQALCWQTGEDGTVEGMYNGSNEGCNVSLPAKPSVDGQHFSHEMEFLVSATGAKAVQPTNAITEKYSLYGRYSHLSGTVGFLDNLNPERMTIEFLDYGKLLSATTLTPGSGPAHFNVDIAHVQVLTLMVANVSGAAPNWNGYLNQYVPGAVVIANPVLTPAG